MIRVTEVRSDGTTVWVDKGAYTVARFSPMGVDIHTATADGCIDCTPGPCTVEDWERFKAGVFEHHGIVVDDAHKPTRI